MFFKQNRTVHFVGVGGIGLSGLARICMHKGILASGSDSKPSAITDALQQEGLNYFTEHKKSNVPEDCDLLVFSEAVPSDNPERQAAKEMDIPEMNYFEALAAATTEHKLIAIAGTHGKTTTTAMLSLILIRAGLDPMVLVGTKLKEFKGSNVNLGAGEYFVVEACEYRDNFRHLSPWLLGVVNMDLDHIDAFASQEEYEAAFKRLAAKSDAVIWPEEIPDYQGPLGVPGAHNRADASLAAHCARQCGVEESVIESALAEFTGTWRRFEYKGECNGAPVIDDYGHHPVEIAAVLKTVREQYPDKTIKLVFQPHQYSRTKAFFDEFVQELSKADEVWIPNIYECRDTEEDKSITAEDLVAAIEKAGGHAKNGNGVEATAQTLKSQDHSKAIILVMGAGNVTEIANALVY